MLKQQPVYHNYNVKEVSKGHLGKHQYLKILMLFNFVSVKNLPEAIKTVNDIKLTKCLQLHFTCIEFFTFKMLTSLIFFIYIVELLVFPTLFLDEIPVRVRQWYS